MGQMCCLFRARGLKRRQGSFPTYMLAAGSPDLMFRPTASAKNGSRYQITAVHVLAGISQDPFLRKTFAPHGLAAASAGPSPALALENSSSGSSPPLSSCLMWVPRFLTFFPALVSSNCGLMTFLYLRKASQSAC